ncbi:hypothetical protein J5N97_016463 [Dioscorea zingiberensis]|uniref:DYW domain-containing protein n=1 Tax=Dioscorea zingiberensis TaxID=325984 RepID=A0A9D5CL63_9LILI|nr:hypothetical protein J5N97_016463 [Dioscorea zingiberensis]
MNNLRFLITQSHSNGSQACKGIHHCALEEDLLHKHLSMGEVELARKVFDEIPQPSVFLWNAMIRAYSWKGPFHRAIKLYYDMLNSGVKPNKFTFPFVLKACSSLLALEEGEEIHEYVRRIGLESDLFVSTALIDMYMKCGCLDESCAVFDGMPNRDVVSWNAMIAGFALHGMYEDTIGYVLEMQNAGTRPNRSTVVTLLPVVGQAKALTQGRSIHGYCVRRYFDEDDILVGTALLDMYMKCTSLVYACRIFGKMSSKNEVTWSAMIGGYVLCDRMMDALEVFDQMMLEGSSKPASSSLASALRACAKLADLNGGKTLHNYSIKFGFLSDITIGNSLLSMYAKIGSIGDAVKYLDEMEFKDTVSYSAIISGYVQNGNAKEAFAIFKSMLSNVEPDVATMVGIIPACSHLSALQHGKLNHGLAIIHGLASDVSVSNALIDMYMKCGRIDHGREVFDRMSKRDVVSWNTMIAGYGTHGRGKEAISLFLNMQAECIVPDDITFICLLSACSHSGLVTEGKHWFHAMTLNYRIKPRMEHYICLVDLLGRGGYLDEAREYIRRMPFEPDVRVWGALLGACRIHKNIELGEEVSQMIGKLGPEGTGNFVLLSNIYSAAGRFNEAAQVRIMQRDKGFMKSPGCSWIEIKGNIHAFIGGDRTHPQSQKIYGKLQELLVEIKKLGYRPDTSFVLHDMDDEEKEHALLYHSEKLAIAFAILSSSNDKPIFVTKNLRVCGDCHGAIKLITLVSKRVIVVRDASRFHHFSDGMCNCRDFW